MPEPDNVYDFLDNNINFHFDIIAVFKGIFLPNFRLDRQDITACLFARENRRFPYGFTDAGGHANRPKSTFGIMGEKLDFARIFRRQRHKKPSRFTLPFPEFRSECVAQVLHAALMVFHAARYFRKLLDRS